MKTLLNLPPELLRSVCLQIYDPLNLYPQGRLSWDPQNNFPGLIAGDPDAIRRAAEKDLRSLALTCRAVRAVACTVLRLRVDCWELEQLGKLDVAQWASDIRFLALDIACYPPTRPWTSGRPYMRLIYRLSKLQHLRISACCQDDSCLDRFVRGLMPMENKRLLADLKSFEWMVCDMVDHKCEHEDSSTELFLPWLEQAPNLTSLTLQFQYRSTDRTELREVFRRLSKKRLAGSVDVRIAGVSTGEYHDEIRLSPGPDEKFSFVRSLYYAPNPHEDEGGDREFSEYADQVFDTLAAFDHARIIGLPVLLDADEESHIAATVPFLEKAARAMPRLLAVGITEDRKACVCSWMWWGIWRRKSLNRGPTFSGFKLDLASDEDPDGVKVIAPLEEGHLEILEAEADEWDAKRKEEGADGEEGSS